MLEAIATLVISAALSVSATITPEVVVPEVVYYGDPNCKTPPLHVDETARIIRETQTMNLNFVKLADVEGGLYNHASGAGGLYRGIFQVHTGFHKLDDYCSPTEQVQWLERKINEGADPRNLFPGTYKYLYYPQE